MIVITSDSIIMPARDSAPSAPGDSRRAIYVDSDGNLRIVDEGGSLNAAPAMPYLSSFDGAAEVTAAVSVEDELSC